MQNIRNNIIRLAETNSNSFKSFITLTYNRDVTEEENTKYLYLFFKKLRRIESNLKYLWVIERTKKERIHIHLLTSLEFKECNSKGRKSEQHKQREQEFEKLWSYKGKILGWVDIRSLDGANDKRKIIKYLAKYFNKSFDSTKLDKNKHIWGYSIKTLDKPIIEKFSAMLSLESLLKDFSKDYEITYSSSYSLFIDGVEVSKRIYIDMYRKGINDEVSKM